MSFTPAAYRFLRGIKQNNNKPWFESHREEYERDLREPMRALIVEMTKRFPKFAPEMTGDPKRSIFRINRDIRFSRDKSPYKTNAGCWFNHRLASKKVGGDATDGSAGLYFHLEPGRSFLGAGLWMPPRPQLDKLRDSIVAKPAAFTKMERSLKPFGGLDEEHMLKRVPRGYAPDHPMARALRFNSFVAGRKVTDAQVVGGKLPAILEKEYRPLMPLVRWINSSLGWKS